ncbi:tryptophan-rich sensory protein [Duganella dendranthematis]|uniref:Tryptophan-rich sensory protein n=1 Tax=Duganella dendranthematis TaxID=2728021 RepID=A0ABX6MH87_9BURK|nr:TspO/MBR family protein [Duganella dendranthematis]QJD93304.1 tryptophan-rich sensory protein [Duganella dendranthematis]
MSTQTAAPHRPLQLPALAGWLILTFIFAAIGAYASAQAADFYLQLDRPAWAPPAWLFGPAWSALYLLMAISAWHVQRTATNASARPALTLYVVQLAANALWTWLFFGWHLGAWAFAEILLLWVLIAAIIVAFWRRDRVAGLLLVPYIGWVSFATCLCYSIWQRNPSVL